MATMKDDTIKAYRLLRENDYTCVLCRGRLSYCSRERGVAPLLEHLEEPVDFTGFSAADKIVGNAAAFLYVLLGVDEVRAEVMSRAAAETLRRYGIRAFCDTEAETIYNRTNTGICPMEEAVQGAASPEEACKRIREKLAQLRQSDAPAAEGTEGN